MSCFRGEGRGHGHHTSLNNAAPCGYFPLRSWLVITEGDTNPSTWCQKYGSILFWIKLSSVITFQPPQPVSETSLQALRREWFFVQNYEIMTLWGPELWEPTRYLQGNLALLLLDSWQTTSRTRLKYLLGVKRGSCSAENRPNLSWMTTSYYPKLVLGEVVCLHSI